MSSCGNDMSVDMVVARHKRHSLHELQSNLRIQVQHIYGLQGHRSGSILLFVGL